MIGTIIKKLWLILFVSSDNSIHYICSGEALPHPLPSDEEASTLQQLSEGSAAARTTLIERNLRLVVYIARKFDNTGVDIDDLISVGSIGLIKAVNSFDYSKKIKLATYASRCIENEILMHLRRVVRFRGEVSLDEPLNVDWEGNELLLSDILGTEPDLVSKDIESSVEKQLLHASLQRLKKREKEIMDMRFGLDGRQERTQKEVADILGISQSYISRLEKKIIYRLRQHLAKAL
jgi:RNA polymerase sporulation-specific sigma factor